MVLDELLLRDDAAVGSLAVRHRMMQRAGRKNRQQKDRSYVTKCRAHAVPPQK
jgi:hypothetical protein